MSEIKGEYKTGNQEVDDAMEPIAEVGWSDDKYPMPDEIRRAANQIALWLSREKVNFCMIYWDGKMECGNRFTISAPSSLTNSPRTIYNKNGGYIYLLYAPDHNLYKIGMSKDAPKRSGDIAKQSPVQIDILHSFWSNDARNAEKILHDRNAKTRVRGEWFSLSQNEVFEILALQDGDL